MEAGRTNCAAAAQVAHATRPTSRTRTFSADRPGVTNGPDADRCRPGHSSRLAVAGDFSRCDPQTKRGRASRCASGTFEGSPSRRARLARPPHRLDSRHRPGPGCTPVDFANKIQVYPAGNIRAIGPHPRSGSAAASGYRFGAPTAPRSPAPSQARYWEDDGRKGATTAPGPRDSGILQRLAEQGDRYDVTEGGYLGRKSVARDVARVATRR